MKNKRKKMIPDDVVRAILDQDVVPESEETSEDVNAYDLAMLAAQIRPGLSLKDTDEAIETAWELLKKAKFKLWQIDFKKGVEADSPQLEAESREQEEKRLAALQVGYERGVKIITNQKAWSYALSSFKQFLASKAHKEGKGGAWVDAKLANCRIKGFTGTEAKKLQEEFREYRGYRGQGRVKKKGDLRLRENKKKKLEKAQKAAGSQTKLTKAEVEQVWGEEFSDSRLIKPKRKAEQFWDSTEARRTASEKRSGKLKSGT